MKFNKFAAVLSILVATPSLAVAQSPGSIEWELKYAREYLEGGNWSAAMRGYEDVLERDPTNAEARAGYAKAKENSEAKKAVQAEQVGLPEAQRPKPVPRSSPNSNGGKSKPLSRKLSAKNQCDHTFTACWVTSKNTNPACFAQRAACYRRSGIN